MNNRYPTPRQDYKVMVRCHTYNHGKYITDTLNGFSTQKTNFPYCVLVLDDASRDNEQQVILDYIYQECDIENAEVFDNDVMLAYVVKHKDNSNCTFVFILLKENHFQQGKRMIEYYQEWRNKSTYEALCEGDDYWTSETKLQMQCDFLDTNLDYAVVHTDFHLSSNEPRNHYSEIYEDGQYFPGLLHNGSPIATVTTMYRVSVFLDLDRDYETKKWPMHDYPMWIEFSHCSKIKYINIDTSAYRVLANSAQHDNDINKLIMFKEKGVEVAQFYATKFNIELDNKGYNKKYYLDVMRFAYRCSNKSTANEYIIKAIKNKRLSLKLLVYYFCTIIPLLKRILGNH